MSRINEACCYQELLPEPYFNRKVNGARVNSFSSKIGSQVWERDVPEPLRPDFAVAPVPGVCYLDGVFPVTESAGGASGLRNRSLTQGNL
jgi:hypothetical protein